MCSVVGYGSCCTVIFISSVGIICCVVGVDICSVAIVYVIVVTLVVVEFAIGGVDSCCGVAVMSIRGCVVVGVVTSTSVVWCMLLLLPLVGCVPLSRLS